MNQSINSPFRKEEYGATVLEVSISLLVFLFTLVVGIELALISYQKASLRYALIAAGGRTAILGNTPSGYNRLLFIKETLIARANQFGVELSPSDIRICLASDPMCSGESQNAGRGEDWIYISAEKEINRLTFIPTIKISSSLVVRNESFPSRF